jgi:hypothetical protein
VAGSGLQKCFESSNGMSVPFAFYFLNKAALLLLLPLAADELKMGGCLLR